ncbi:LysM domain-containing protein [Anaerospora sp.]|uniref:LysM peptidoglycan-binding domain-containing protein n=1 Tax=Anaerospora sp. TaxID=1960278 RepID=UPI00289849A6|nr:LysM domain-containing protein [Anaerospora sp.]
MKVVTINKSQYNITLYIAEAGTPLTNEKDIEYSTTDDKGNEIYYTQAAVSAFGHIWFSLDGGPEGKIYYGFGPAVHGNFSGEGHVFKNDDKAYAFIKYQESYPLTKRQYDNILGFAQNADNNKSFGEYNGLTNACVDFCFEALRVGEVFTDETLPVPRDGSLLPSMNIPNLKAIKSVYMKGWNAGQERYLNNVQQLNTIEKKIVASRQEASNEKSIKDSNAKSHFHVIQPGDTLGAIAVSNDVSVTAILANNPQINNVDYIQPDEILYIPDKSVQVMPSDYSGLDGLSLFENNAYLEKLSNPFKDQIDPKQNIVLKIDNWFYDTAQVINEQEIQVVD